MKIEKLEFCDTNIYISWTHEGKGYETMLYRHSDDYSWHLDPETRAMDPGILQRLQNAVYRVIAKKPAVPEVKKKRKKGDVWFAEQCRPSWFQ